MQCYKKSNIRNLFGRMRLDKKSYDTSGMMACKVPSSSQVSGLLFKVDLILIVDVG